MNKASGWTATAVAISALCPTATAAYARPATVAIFPDPGEGPGLVVDAFKSRKRHEIHIDYVKARGSFEIRDSHALRAQTERCRRVKLALVRCAALDGARTDLYVYGGDRPNHVTIDSDALGYEYFETGGADDVLRAGRRASSVEVLAGKGDDTIFGSDGEDDLSGHEGNDAIYGRRGVDLLGGDEGKNRIFGGGGNDIVDVKNGRADRGVNCGPGGEDSVWLDRDLDPRPKGCEQRNL